MQIHLKISERDQHSPKEFEYLICTVDDKFFLTGRETPIDVILTAISDISPVATDKDNVRVRLEILRDRGMTSPRGYVFTEALCMNNKPDGLTPRDAFPIHVNLATSHISIGENLVYSLEDFCGSAPDRTIGEVYPLRREGEHPFAFRYKDQDVDVHPTDLAAGSLMSGLFSVLTPGPWGTCTAQFAALVGLLIGGRGDIFRSGRSDHAREGYSAMDNMHAAFFRTGMMCADRGWMPQQYVRGDDFDKCITLSDPRIFEIGTRFADLAIESNPALVRRALDHVMSCTNQDPVQFGLRRSYLADPSSHEKLHLAHFIQRMATAADLNPTTFSKRTSA